MLHLINTYNYVFAMNCTTFELHHFEQAVKKWCGLKSLGKKSWEIKGTGQEWLQ